MSTNTPKGCDTLGTHPYDRRLQGTPPRDTPIRLVAVIKKEKTQPFTLILNHTFKRRDYSRRDMSLHSYPLD
ncbi:hypothetical protein HanRHA438_Chr09g0397191 [Helianthus annuus]|nr:hypothetical protein HanRHA438_Chr09g0397191 [Helianthus annuus]